MRKSQLALILLFVILCLSCGNKKDSIDTSSWYFKVKIDNQWRYLPDDLGAFLRTEYSGDNHPFLAFSAKNEQTKEYLLFNFNITIIRYNADSTVMHPPTTKYSFHHFEYTVNNKKVIETRSSPFGGSANLGTISLHEFKVVDTTRKLAGYFKGNMSYVDDAGKTVTITEGQFNLPRNDQKVYN
ncbi:hypothetical protein [Niabella aurantiaca]|uniref:hypothetical protein n=1 Tax=Niabella aurantiaca TaxID=379900 RepID=UPI000372F6D9|nr:hypothetical protein [Niabella aurantiaca]